MAVSSSRSASHRTADSCGSDVGIVLGRSINGAIDNDGANGPAIQFHTSSMEKTVKPHLIGLRKTESNDNNCYGVRVSETQALISGCNENFNFFDFITCIRNESTLSLARSTMLVSTRRQ